LYELRKCSLLFNHLTVLAYRNLCTIKTSNVSKTVNF